MRPTGARQSDVGGGLRRPPLAPRVVVLEAAAQRAGPYRWNLRRLRLGRVLDVGCGIGRNLQHLDADAVGVDHNQDSVTIARQRGLTAYVPEAFFHSLTRVRAASIRCCLRMSWSTSTQTWQTS